MYVKSLTLRGFKSFASATTLKLEPGITAIVGPNGSGKSNVVDALAWVMGEQGAKSLRGGTMEDVIFAGTAQRPPLGRAEVTMTIDNSDGALPIDYSEVTLRRTMFRSGGSEYALNGTPCRLLDVQELLSDSGIGREMHVIVGQGQLDAVLRATPEERRGFIEEAAGVLKHRKRKERALRKLAAMEANLTRLTDLTAEIRRQLGPLGRQAETARRAGAIQAQARDARARLLADDLAQSVALLEQGIADESAVLTRRAELSAELEQAREQLNAIQARVAAATPAVTSAQERWFALASLRDRLGAIGALAAERHRLLTDDGAESGAGPERQAGTAGRGGRDPEQLRASAAQLRAEQADLEAGIQQRRQELDVAVAARAEAEAAYATERDRVAALQRAAAYRREQLARLRGAVAAVTSRIEAGEAERDRLLQVIERSTTRATEAEREFARLEGTVAADEEGEEGLDAAYEAARAELEAGQEQVRVLQEAERTAERDRSGALARCEALELSLRSGDGAQLLLDEAAGVGEAGFGAAVLGPLSATLQVRPGWESAVAAALGPAAEAVAMASVEAAGHALLRLRERDAGRAAMLVPVTEGIALPGDGRTVPAADLPDGAIPATEAVTCRDDVMGALAALLGSTVLVADLASATQLRRSHPQLTAVTADGDVLAPGWVYGGSSGAPSHLELRAALEAARSALDEAGARRDRARFALVAARERVAEARERSEAALRDLNASDARMAGLAEQLGSWNAIAASARAEAARTEATVAQAGQRLEEARAERERLQDQLGRAQAHADAGGAGDGGREPATDTRDQLDAAAGTARGAETEARLALRTAEERVLAIAGRADALEAAARAETAARLRDEERRQRRAAQAAVAARVRRAAELGADELTASVELALAARTAAETARGQVEEALTAARARVDEVTAQVAELTDAAHRDEVARAAQRIRIEQLEQRGRDELGLEPEVLVAEFGPHRLVPDEPSVPPDAGGTEGGSEHGSVPDQGSGTAYVREVQEKRLAAAERKLNQLGRINPLALEEFAALEERHAFLTSQVEDLRRSKRDLLDIVREVDARVQQVFADAYADTAAAFEGVFARLFPGGQGRLVLTDPDDMLTTGIEVEARPPGKKIKRLSLLSGGERSLTAVALLVAIFKARPSPFYIMDEVEAALDDTNLDRLLVLFEELRDSSQLIVITHQKRTMEVADALYGVSMRGDGVTTVVSQRLAEVVRR
ncbi:MAG: chromosome segregation protein SMC [Austwickia sp.]|nr:chromosome segregation protein SMC [Austwickia sp.]